nr:immunoglobulin heavy chain junction region [Mus musculus]
HISVSLPGTGTTL